MACLKSCLPSVVPKQDCLNCFFQPKEKDYTEKLMCLHPIADTLLEETGPCSGWVKAEKIEKKKVG